ncbi:MAG: formylglycine-generating enzyme family protein [Acidobacteriota bacterium]
MDGKLIRDRDRAEVVRVEGVTFRMGSTPAEIAAIDGLTREFGADAPTGDLGPEQPAHQVTVDTFLLDRYEVTNAHYRQFARETGHAPPSNSFGSHYDVWTDDAIPEGLEHHPVVNVGWDDAVAYCRWAGGRLPTEAEWELAARGPKSRVFPWGNHWDHGRANHGSFDPAKGEWRGFSMDGYLNTAPVGSFPAGKSPCGAEDMAGNAMEWVQDVYDPAYYERSPSRNPTGPEPPPPPEDDDSPGGDKAPEAGKSPEGDTSAGEEAPPPREERALRGGSWYYDPIRLRGAYRHHLAADIRNANTGFRCAMPLP